MQEKGIEKFTKVFGEIKIVEEIVERKITVATQQTKPVSGGNNQLLIKDSLPQTESHNPWYSTINPEVIDQARSLCITPGVELIVGYTTSQKGDRVYQNIVSLRLADNPEPLAQNEEQEGGADQIIGESLYDAFMRLSETYARIAGLVKK